jgi:hypothetical protein
VASSISISHIAEFEDMEGREIKAFVEEGVEGGGLNGFVG